MGDHGHNRQGPKREDGAVVTLLAAVKGELSPRLTQCGLGGRGPLPYQVVSSSIQLFGHNRHGQQTGGRAPFRGSCDSIQHNVASAEINLRTKWHLDPSSCLATIDMGGCAPFLGGAMSPSSTMCPRLRLTFMPSAILIHPAVWPQYTWTENWGIGD